MPVLRSGFQQRRACFGACRGPGRSGAALPPMVSVWICVGPVCGPYGFIGLGIAYYILKTVPVGRTAMCNQASSSYELGLFVR